LGRGHRRDRSVRLVTDDKRRKVAERDQPSVVVTLVTALDNNGQDAGFPGSRPVRVVVFAPVPSAPVTHPAQPPLPSPDRARVPPPLAVAAALVAVEALMLVVFGVVELRSVQTSKLAMGLTTSLFFGLYGVGLGLCAWQLHRLRSWTRAPVVLAQLIQLGVAWSFRSGATAFVSVLLTVVAVVVLAGIFHPASLRALTHADEADQTGPSPS